jgi:hypothetical protein
MRRHPSNLCYSSTTQVAKEAKMEDDGTPRGLVRSMVEPDALVDEDWARGWE